MALQDNNNFCYGFCIESAYDAKSIFFHLMTMSAQPHSQPNQPIAPNQSLAPQPMALPNGATRASPIGIFDSGIGGLSVAMDVHHYLPNEQILYFADTAHVPYGARSDEEIRRLTAEAIDWLYQQGCKAAIVACNTASAFSLDYLRQYYGEQFPIIGLVPAVKPAVIQSQTKVVAVLATPATFRGKLIQDVVQHFALPAGVKVMTTTCLDLVPLIEQGKALDAECLLALQQCLQPVIDAGADHLVLGCTHYPFLKTAIERLYGDQLILVDSGQAVARQCGRVLQKFQLQNEQLVTDFEMKCVFSGNNQQSMQKVVENLIQNRLVVRLTDLLDFHLSSA